MTRRTAVAVTVTGWLAVLAALYVLCGPWWAVLATGGSLVAAGLLMDVQDPTASDEGAP